MNLSKTITDAELEIMKILWREGVPISSTEIRLELKETKNWEKSTVLTLLRRLADKGIITVVKGDPSSYTPNIKEEDYIAEQTQDMLDRLYGGSVKNLVAALCDSKLTEQDIIELKNYFMEEGK